MDGWLRCLGGAVGFGFAAVWITASLTAALVCVLAAAVGYAGVAVAGRARAKLVARRSSPSTLATPTRPPQVEDLPSWADALNSDLGHIYQPAATAPLTREAEYGWPLTDDAPTPSETLH